MRSATRSSCSPAGRPEASTSATTASAVSTRGESEAPGWPSSAGCASPSAPTSRAAAAAAALTGVRGRRGLFSNGRSSTRSQTASANAPAAPGVIGSKSPSVRADGLASSGGLSAGGVGASDSRTV
eukprot:scaffold72279_cov63-Phaeocystis_antarctica.AAC.1